jgi:SlyX protein
MTKKIQSNGHDAELFEHHSVIESRLTALEIKSSYAEVQIDQLDKVIIRQQEQIDLLIQEITVLRQSSTDGGMGAARNLRDDLPPHF